MLIFCVYLYLTHVSLSLSGLRPAYSLFIPEGVLANILGILLVCFGVLLGYLITREEYRRPPNPDEEETCQYVPLKQNFNWQSLKIGPDLILSTEGCCVQTKEFKTFIILVLCSHLNPNTNRRKRRRSNFINPLGGKKTCALCTGSAGDMELFLGAQQVIFASRTCGRLIQQLIVFFIIFEFGSVDWPKQVVWWHWVP